MPSGPTKSVRSQQLDPADDQAMNSKLLVWQQKCMVL